MRASVVINNYNYGTFVADAIESALGQTWADTEVVVVDDGSTDDSRRIIAAYASRARVVYQPNRGQCAAVNAGFAVSSGGLVIFLDSDDILEPHAVEQASRNLAPGMSQIHWPLTEIGLHGVPTGVIQPPWPLRAGSFLDEAIERGPVVGLATQLSGNAWPRWYLERVLPLPEGRRSFAADMYLFTLCAVHGSTHLIDAPLTRYRVHGANDHSRGTAGQRLRRLLESWDELCRVLAAELEIAGHAAPSHLWPQRNEYGRWLARWARAVEHMKLTLPAGSRYVFADRGTWDGADLIGTCEAVPFTERDGRFWGPPANDRSGWDELLRQRGGGARYLVVADDPGWWQESYPRLWADLGRLERLVDDEAVVIFGLDGA